MKENLNPNNIMEDSTLKIIFKEAKNLKDEGGNYLNGKFVI